jgi:hypothetical protein
MICFDFDKQDSEISTMIFLFPEKLVFHGFVQKFKMRKNNIG